MSTESAPAAEAQAPETPITSTDTAPASSPTETSVSSPAASESTSSSESWLDHLDSVFGEDPVEEPKQGEEPEQSADSEEAEESKEVETKDEKSKEDDSSADADEEADSEPKNMSVEARRAFKEFRVKNRELSKQLEAAQSELKKLKETPSTDKSPEVAQLTEENKQLKEKLGELNSELTTVAVEATPEYKEQVIRPLVDTLRSVQALSERYNVSKRLLERAIEESAETGAPTEELTDAASSMNSFDQQELHLLVRGMRSVMERKAWYKENAQALATQKQRGMEERQKAIQSERTAATLNAAEDVWKRLSDLPPVKGIPDEEREKAYQMAKNAVTSLEEAPADIRSYSAFAAALFPNVLKQVKASQTKIKELEATLSKYTKAKPKAGAGTSDGGIPQPSEGLSFLDAIEAGIGV